LDSSHTGGSQEAITRVPEASAEFSVLCPVNASTYAPKLSRSSVRPDISVEYCPFGVSTMWAVSSAASTLIVTRPGPPDSTSGRSMRPESHTNVEPAQ
jgi:hypothetical protein